MKFLGLKVHLWFLASLLAGCRADVWVEEPGARSRATADSVTIATTAADTVYRPVRIDSVGASFAWIVERPAPRIPQSRAYPSGPIEAVRQYVRALGQTGSGTRGSIGVGQVGYERAFTYVHPRVRRATTLEAWTERFAGLVRPTIVQVLPVPGDSTRVFVELALLRDVDGQSLLGLYYGHLQTAPGDNGWQLTGARLASEDWQSRLGEENAWRYDRALAARRFAEENAEYTPNLVALQSGEWVPVMRPAPTADVTLGLPALR